MAFCHTAEYLRTAGKYLVCILIVVVLATAGRAQPLATGRIYLKNEVLHTGNNVNEWLSDHPVGQVQLPVQLLVQFDILPTPARKNLLQANGITLTQYIPDNAYLAVMHAYPSREFLASQGLKFISSVFKEWKMSDEIKAIVNNEDIEICVLFTEGIAEKEALSRIYTAGGTIINNRIGTMGYCSAVIPGNNLATLTEWYGVHYVTVYKEDMPLNINAKAVTRGAIASGNINDGGYGLKGAGIAIGVGDNVSGIFHVDLMDRIINYNPHGYTNHGVHINGIVGGAGIVDPKGEGMAPLATLTNHYFSDVLDATPDISALHNVIVTNNSYSAIQGSCESSGNYDVLSVGLDKLCNNYNTVLQVFAAANNGLFDCPPFPQGFATITGGYQPAKNNIVVASTDKLYVNAGNSSRGPVKDGRLKPEITAVGVNVNSATKTDEYLVASGTSMACPQVAGAAALLAERIKQLNGITKPRADLLKTLLINGATDIGIPGPDFRFGFGFLNVERSLVMLDSNRYFTAAVSNGGQNTHAITVPPGTGALKVTICWHDPAASPMASKVLVNDLDLEVSAPGGKITLPLVLDPSPANVEQPATERADRLNNTEQVTIDVPAAGSYTITVKGHNIPSGSQAYVVAYDLVPPGIDIDYPQQGSVIKADDSVYIYWSSGTASGDKYSLEYSDNDGSNWNMIDNNIPPGQTYYKWLVPAGINSGRCRMRLVRNAEQSVSGMFTINKQPEVLLSNIQCPGYIQIEWGAIPNATAYEVLRKTGPVMAVVDTVADTSFVFSGLSFDSTYYVAVRPLIDGMSGYRSIATKRRPSDGDCNGNISDGDLVITRTDAPATGRMFTGTELSADETLQIRVRNLDDTACDSFNVSYRINGGTWVTEKQTSSIAAGAVQIVSVTGLNLAAAGDYWLQIAIENLDLADPVSVNDTVHRFISQLPNPPVTLDYTDGFETLPVFSSSDTAGFGNNRRWDYQGSTDTGRLRTFIFDNTTLSGRRSISLDAYKSCQGNFNVLTGTFNLATYDAATDEVRLEFDYIVHGIPKSKPGNEVYVHGKETTPIQIAYEYDVSRENIGRITNSGSISLSDIMLKTNDNFSTATQLQFGQNDTSVIGSRSVGNGISFDDIKLYTVQNDVQLLEVIAPETQLCGVTGLTPLVLKIRNGVTQEQADISVSYRLDGGAVVTETISSLSGKETINFTFGTLLDLTKLGNHSISIWIAASGDSYAQNDSINDYKVRNQPYVRTFPYFEDFEANDGYWFTDGIKSSWSHGVPSSAKVNTAASGQKAWVTNLEGTYNDDELSYLYSPCFDLSGLEHPVFSSKMFVDIENCGFILCDAAYLEYTSDGVVWKRLGKYGEGTNWYTDSNYQAWNIEDNTTWRQAEIELPDTLADVQFRYVLQTDPGGTREGLGIDDIRIYNRKLYLPDNSIISVSPNPVSDGLVNIEWAAHSGTELLVAMTDITGREVYRSAATAGEGYNKTTLQTPLFSTGMYFMRIIIGDKEHERKIIYRGR